MAILATEEAEAVTNTKLDAVEQSILQEESSYLLLKQKDVEVEDTESRTKAWVDIHNPKHEPELGDPNLVNTFAIMPDITGNAQKMLPPTNRSLKQGQAEQGQTAKSSGTSSSKVCGRSY